MNRSFALGLIFGIVILFYPVLAYNITSEPTVLDITLNKNESKNISFKIINYENITFNISFRTKKRYAVNFTPEYFKIEKGQSVKINTTIISFEDEGEYNDTISVTNNENLTTEGLFEIPLKIFVGKRIKAEFYFKKCFIDNETEYCAKVNISEIQNVTIINITNETKVYNVVVPFNVFQDYIESSKREQREIKESIINASQTLAGERSEKERIYDNAQIIKSILRNSKDTWIEIKPNNILQNITGLSDEDFANAIQYLEEKEEITTQIIKEDLPYVIVAPPDFTPKRSILHTQIGLTDRVNADTVNFYAMMIVTVSVITLSIFLIGMKIWNKYRATPKWKV